MAVSPLSKIILLSSVLAVGFLLIVLSCALFGNWAPLSVVGIFLVAPIPNSICGQWAGDDEFMGDSNSSVVDFGRFMTAFFVLTGLALPIVLAHAAIICLPAMYMSIAGGLLVYITIIIFTLFFQETEEF